jgi:tRNA(Ile)-lysidine synthase
LIATARDAWSALAGRPGPVVVAVSGGPDSVALLRALLGVGAGPLTIAHLNHQMRGSESDTDEAFVRDFHAGLVAAGHTTLGFCCERIDVPARARADRDNLENAARRARYDWLLQVAQERGAQWVATGHTADDQAETVLHRLLRGTGIKGLAGISARRPLGPGLEVIRPLLRATRAEVLAFLRDQGQPYRQDTANADLRFTRNRIRHALLPFLAEEYNPAIVPVLCRLADQAGEVFDVLDGQARRLLAEAELPRTQTALVLDREVLARVPPFLVREALRRAWEREGWPMGAMTFDDWDRLAAVALGEIPATDLSGGLRARCRERVIQIGRW